MKSRVGWVESARHTAVDGLQFTVDGIFVPVQITFTC